MREILECNKFQLIILAIKHKDNEKIRYIILQINPPMIQYLIINCQNNALTPISTFTVNEAIKAATNVPKQNHYIKHTIIYIKPQY